MKTLGNPRFTVKENGEFDGEYEVDECFCYPEIDWFDAGLSFNEKGEYLVSFCEKYIYLCKNKREALHTLIFHMAHELDMSKLKEK